MNNRLELVALLSTAALLTLSASAEDAQDRSADVWRSPPGSARPVKLPRERRDTGPMMPLMEISLIERLCNNPAFQSKTGKSRDDCAKAVFSVKSKCTKEFHRKFPRGDNADIDGRQNFRKFSEGYMRCLRRQYAAERAR